MFGGCQLQRRLYRTWNLIRLLVAYSLIALDNVYVSSTEFTSSAACWEPFDMSLAEGKSSRPTQSLPALLYYSTERVERQLSSLRVLLRSILLRTYLLYWCFLTLTSQSGHTHKLTNTQINSEVSPPTEGIQSKWVDYHGGISIIPIVDCPLLFFSSWNLYYL